MNIVSKVEEINLLFKGLDKKKVLYLFDIDNTIITTKSNFGNNIDKLKILRQKFLSQNEDLVNEIDNLIVDWRLAREVVLTDEAWPEFLQDKIAYGLTKMDTGKLGKIKSMEQWRNEELKSLSIKFSPKSPIDGKSYDKPSSLGISDATFFNGIFYVGNAQKGQVVKAILNSQKYDLVTFVDDRESELFNVEKACSECGIDYLPINFQIKMDPEDYIQKEEEKQAEKAITEFLSEQS